MKLSTNLSQDCSQIIKSIYVSEFEGDAQSKDRSQNGQYANIIDVWLLN